MKVFCYGCKSVEKTNWLARCPKCETMDIGIEEDKGWHGLCRLFAQSKGWLGDSGTVSLPLWFEKEPEQLPQWGAFKAKLLDVYAIPLPSHLKGRYGETFEYWVHSSGVLPLQQGSLHDLISQLPVGPLVHKLATDFANHHKQRWEAEDNARKEEVERLTKPKKKPRLLQRVGRRRKHV